MNTKQAGWSIGAMFEPGDEINFDGVTMALLGGGVRENFDSWIPVEMGGDAIKAFQQRSAVDFLGRHEPMKSDLKDVPRSGGFTVGGLAKGGQYGENVPTNDKVRLNAEKIGGATRVAEEDLDDSDADILAAKESDAAVSMAKFYDNAALATSAVSNGTTILYDSVYYKLTQTNAATGYTANANIKTIATAVAPTYDDLSNTLALIESSDFVDEANLVWIGSPAWKAYLRGLKNTQGDPIWREGAALASPDTILGYPVYWTRGAKKSAVNSSAPTGNPLLFVGDRSMLINGDRSGMESAVQLPGSGVGFLTDEALMKVRMRKGFALGHETAWAVIDKTP